MTRHYPMSSFAGRPQTAPAQSWQGSGVLRDGMLIDTTPAPGNTFTRDTWPPRGRGRGESLLSPRRVAAKMRSIEVIRLRAQGLTFTQIARNLGFRDGSGAYRAMKRSLDRIDWDERRREELGMRSVYESRSYKIRAALRNIEREIEEMSSALLE
jgi:hypothetical protein